MDDDKIEKMASSIIESEALNETSDYLQRGRQLSGLCTQEVEDFWTISFREWFAARSKQRQTKFDDAAAELRLREQEPPYGSVNELINEMRQEMKNKDAEYGSDDPLSRIIDKYLKDRGNPSA